MPSNKHSRRARAPRGLIASLTPEGQVSKVMADMNSLKGGHDLRNWSASARKELMPSLTIALQVGADASSRIYMPKLALVAISPVVCAYLKKDPSAVTAKFVHPDISREAVVVLAQWLKDISSQADFPELPIPEDMNDFWKLRLTAYTLGMEQYTDHFDNYYANDVEYRAPDLEEIAAVVENTRDSKDAILGALANQISYLCRYNKVSEARKAAYTNLMVEANYSLLLAAVDEKEVKAKVKAKKAEAKKAKGKAVQAVLEA
jgi:hypothetical protein